MRGEAALRYLLSKPLLCTPEAAAVAHAILAGAGSGAGDRDGAGVPESLAARRGRPVDAETAGVERRGPVTVIPVTGPIVRYADMFTDLCGGVTTEALARDITAALDDPTCSAIVLHIESPGGESAGINELAALIRAGADRKPIVGYSAAEIASAGYYLGAACSELVVGEMAQVGCLGVVMGYIHRDDKPGVKTYEWVSSQSPDKRPDFETAGGRAVVQQVVDDMAAVFLGDVAKYRDTTVEDVTENFGRGSVLVGLKAVDAGMADRIGSLEEVIAELSDPRRSAAPKPAPAAGPGSSVPASASAADPNPSVTFFYGDPNMGLNWLFRPKADGSGIEAIPQPTDAPTSTPKTEAAPADTVAAIDLENSPAVKALREQMATLSAQAAADRAEKILAVGAQFVSLELHAGRLIPAEAKGLLESYVQAAEDDAARPVAAGKPSRVESLKARQSARPKHGLFAEQLGPDDLPAEIRLLGQRPDTGPDRDNPNAPVSAARTDELLAKFPAGQKLLAARKG